MDARLTFPLLRRVRSGLLLAVLGAAAGLGAQEKPAETELIYPRGQPAAEAPAAAGRETGASPLLIVLALGAAAAGGWMLWRQRHGPATGGAARKLVIAESRPLGNRQHLVVADYDGQKFLLGVCPGRIEMLSPLRSDTDDPEDL